MILKLPIEDLINDKNNLHKSFINKKLNSLNEIIETKSTERLDEIFDLDYLSKYFIYCHLTGRVMLSNTRWIYRLTNGKIYPIATSHNRFKKISDIEKKSFWEFILNSIEFKNRLHLNTLNNDFLPNKDAINSLINKYAPLLSSYKRNLNITQTEFNYNLKKDYDVLIDNIENLKKILKQIKQNSLSTQSNENEKFETTIKNFGFSINEKTVIINSGLYFIKQDLIFPNGYNLIINFGAKLILSDSVSVLINGNTDIIGSLEDKVIIKSEGIKPFGAFAIVGNNRQKSTIKFLEIQNGSEAYIDGKYFSGALCLYHQDVHMSNVVFRNNKADDGLNIKYGNIFINNCSFYNNWADQVDIDFCIGKIINCNFKYGKGDNNGDGLDLSGSQVIISNCHFENFNDKGLSVGENSNVQVLNCNFINNQNAISIKDLSSVIAENNILSKNNIAFNLFMKKAIFGGGKIKLNNNKYTDNKILITKDSLSQVIYK